jgi:hypothetical protein
MHAVYHEFSERPLSDSCWSTSTGPDGRIYIACCIEHTGGGTATIVRPRPDGTPEYLFDMDEVTGDRRDSGRATQCKVHYSFVPDPEKDLVWCATHLSGPPIGENRYNPWASWHDPVRAFRGAYLVGWDVKRDRVVHSTLMIPKEGCRCLAFDAKRRVMYALTYPRDHLVRYDLARGELTDLGRLGSVNAQCLFLDRRGRVHTIADRGRVLRYDPEVGRIEELPWTWPVEPCQTAWHAVVYDACEDPSTGAIYGIPWKARPHLARFWPEDGPHGRLEDLGPVSQACDPRRHVSVNLNHVGGLVFAGDGRLHYVKAVWQAGLEHRRLKRTAMPGDTRAVLCAYDPRSGTHSEVGDLSGGAGPDMYIARGARGADGALCFGKICARPAGYFHVRLPDVAAAPTSSCLRMWG